MLFGSRGRYDLTEDQDPDGFLSERARRNGIRSDRWAGRHPVSAALIVGALTAGGAHFTLHRVDGETPFWLMILVAAAVLATTVEMWRMAMKARRKYYGESSEQRR